MKSIIINILVGIFILVSGFQAFGEDWTSEQKEVWSVVEQYFSNLENGDVASTMALIHDESLELFTDKSLPKNKNHTRVAYNSWVSIKPTTKIKPISIVVIDHKVANAFYYLKWESKDGTYSGSERTMRTFMKQGDKWVSIGSISSSCSKLPLCPYGW